MTDVERMEWGLNKKIVEREIEEKFSKLILKSEKNNNTFIIWASISNSDSEYTRDWIDTQDSNELDIIFDKNLKLYLSLHNRNTEEHFISYQIKWAKERQKYYPHYETYHGDMTHFSILQDWIDYLENRMNKLKISIELIGENKSTYSSPIFIHIKKVLEKYRLTNFQAIEILSVYTSAFSPELIQNVIKPIIDFLGKMQLDNSTTTIMELPLLENNDLPEIDLKFDKEQIRFMYDLGIIEFLIGKYPSTLKGNQNQVAVLLSQILKHKRGSAQPTINALFTNATKDKDYPKTTPRIKKIIDHLDSRELK